MQSRIKLIYNVRTPNDTVLDEYGFFVPRLLQRTYNAERIGPQTETGCSVIAYRHQLMQRPAGDFYVVISQDATGAGGLEKIMKEMKQETIRVIRTVGGVNIFGELITAPVKIEFTDKLGYGVAKDALREVGLRLKGGWVIGFYVDKLMPIIPSGNYRNVTAAVVPA